MNNVSSFYDASSERLAIPTLTTSLSLDSLIIQDNDEDKDDEASIVHSRSRGMSMDIGFGFGDDYDRETPSGAHDQELQEDDEDEEIKQIRTANILQRTVYMELEKLKNSEVDSSEHPMLQGDVNGEDSERLVTGELRSKAAASLSASAVLASVMSDAKFDSWQEGFSMYLEKRRSQAAAEQEHHSEARTGQGIAMRHSSLTTGLSSDKESVFDTSGRTASNIMSGSSAEKRPPKGGFLFGDVDWKLATSTKSETATGDCNSTSATSSDHSPTIERRGISTKSHSEPELLVNKSAVPSDLFTINEVRTPTKSASRTLDHQLSLELEDTLMHDEYQSKMQPGVLGSPDLDVSISRRDSVVRRAFTEFHNHTKTENASPFLGEDNSAHGGKVFTSEMFSNYQSNLEKNFKAIDSPTGSSPDESVYEEVDHVKSTRSGGETELSSTLPLTPTVKIPLSRSSPITSHHSPLVSPMGTSTAYLSPTIQCPKRSADDTPELPKGSAIAGVHSILGVVAVPHSEPPKTIALNATLSTAPSNSESSSASVSIPSSFTQTPSTAKHTISVKRDPRAREPCFLPMPGWRYFVEGKSTSGKRDLDMSAILQSIQLDAWITPYIITASILLTDRKLSEKQLTDISFQQDMPRVPSQSQLSVSDKSSVESRSRSNSDLMTVTEDVTLTNFSPASGRSSPSPQTLRDPCIGLDIDDNSCDNESTNQNSYLINPFKYLNPFRNKNKKAERDDLDDSYTKGIRRGVVRSSSVGDVPPLDEYGPNSGMRRVTSHVDVPLSVAQSTPVQDIGSKSKLRFGQRIGRGQRNGDIPTQDQAVYGDLIVSHDEHGVYLSSSQPSDFDPASGVSPSNSSVASLEPQLSTNDKSKATEWEGGSSRNFFSTTPGVFTSNTAPTTIPQFISTLFLHPNCTDLGNVFVCREYRSCSPGTVESGRDAVLNTWEPRRCFLWDNYVFELFLPDTESGGGVDGYDARPVGFINLSDAIVEQIDPSTCPNPTAAVVHRHPSIKRANSMEIDTSDLAPVVSLRYYATAALTSQRRSVVVRRSTRRGTMKLMQQLQAASRHSVRDLYEYDVINESKPDLGTGRYSKCFKAVNKRTRRRVLGEDEGSGDDAGSGSGSGSGLDFQNEIVDDEDEEEYTGTKSREAVQKSSTWRGAFLKRRKKKKKKKKKNKLAAARGSEPLVLGKPMPGLGGGDESAKDESGVCHRGGHIHAGQCALKLVNKREYWDRVRTGKERGDSLSREILAQSHLLNTIIAAANAHANVLCVHPTSPQPSPMLGEDESKPIELPIVQLYGIFETREHFVMEMELMQSLDLSEKLNEVGEFAEEQAKHIAIQLVQAVALCQVNGMVHRDIKLTNIGFPVRTNAAMLPENASATTSSSASTFRKDAALMPLQIKLADFGMAGFVEQDGKLRGRCGTPGYVAPEILKSGKREGYGIGVDMFSIGCVIYTLLCGYEPFFGETDSELIAANKSGEYAFPLPEWGRVSDEAKDFVSKLLDPFPIRRLTVHEALDHPWMAAYGGTINYPPKFNPNSQSTCILS